MLDADGGLLRGTLDLLILKALSWGPRHGYAVAEWVHAVTDGDLLVEEGPALHRPAPARTARLAGVGVGLLGQQSQGEVLPPEPERPRELHGELTRWQRYTQAVAKAIAAPEPLAS